MKDQVVEPLQQRHEDSVYQLHEVARVRAEMVRPNVAGPKWGGYTCDLLRIAGLARAIQMRLPYLHSCTPNYCLKERSLVAAERVFAVFSVQGSPGYAR